MNREEWGLILLVSKPLMYGWLFAIPRLWIPPGRRPSRWRPVLAAILRVAGGIVLGLPLGVVLLSQPAAVAIPALALLRFGLWCGITKLFFREVSWSRNLLFSAGATLLNVVFDFTFFHGSWTDISLC